MKVIKRNAIDDMRIHKHLVRPPVQSNSILVRYARASANDQHARETYVSIAKFFAKFVRLLVVIKDCKPIDKLAVTVFKSLAPVRARFPHF